MTTPVPPELQDQFAELEKIRAANVQTLQDLARMQVGVDPASALMIRINALAEFACRADPAAQLMFETLYETRLQDAMKDVKSQARQAQLQAGALLTPAQVAEMSRQQNGGLAVPPGYQRRARP